MTKFVPFTTELGVGLLQSEGFMSEFGQMLMQKAKKIGANVV